MADADGNLLANGTAPPPADWLDAARQGKLLSYVNSLATADAGPGNPLTAKSGEIGDVWKNLVTGTGNTLAAPVLTGGDALSSWMSGDQGTETKQKITSSVLQMLGLGIGSAPEGLLAAGDRLNSFTGYHGTPHDFDAFSNDAIGTGEGAQAYGYGHYVAGNKGIAEGYRDRLATNTPFHEWPLAQQNAAGTLNYFSGDRDAAIANLMGRNTSDGTEAAELLKSGWSEPKPSGNLLHIEIRPDENELLDWDKPLGQQSNILDKLENLPGHLKDSLVDHADSRGMNSPLDSPHDYTGGEFIRAAQHYNVVDAPEDLSAALHDAGIPGIKYLDASSRRRPDDPAATRNYVIFHPSNLKIIGKNGQEFTPQPVDHDPFAGEPAP